MDLTNIKPCVECAKFFDCQAIGDIGDKTQRLNNRIIKRFVFGYDCFEEHKEVTNG